MNLNRFAALIAVIAIMAGSTSARAAFVNGSFEDGNYSFDGNGAQSLSTGSTTINGWTTIGAELAVIRNANSFGISTPFGDTFLDLTGYHDGSPYGGVEQTIATVVGHTYDVSLYLGMNNTVGDGFGPVAVTVTAGLASGTLSASSSGSGDIWTQETFTFVAQSTSTTVQIQGESTGSGHYIGLDNVSIRDAGAAVPEPASVVMLGLGAVGLLGYNRARKGRAAIRV